MLAEKLWVVDVGDSQISVEPPTLASPEVALAAKVWGNTRAAVLDMFNGSPDTREWWLRVIQEASTLLAENATTAEMVVRPIKKTKRWMPTPYLRFRKTGKTVELQQLWVRGKRGQEWRNVEVINEKPE